jgi:rod shape-determining protein MreB
MFKKLFSNTLYIQIWENRIKAVALQTGAVFDEQPLVAIKRDAKGVQSIAAIGNAALSLKTSDSECINPFSHPRTLLANFTVGEKLLQHIFRHLHEGTLLRPSPQVVIQPMEKLEGGLSEVETRAFQELAAGAGARDVVVYVGKALQTEDFNFVSFKKQHNSSPTDCRPCRAT